MIKLSINIVIQFNKTFDPPCRWFPGTKYKLILIINTGAYINYKLIINQERNQDFERKGLENGKNCVILMTISMT